MKRYSIDEFGEKLFLAYLPALPPGGYDRAEDLMVYCSVTGLLFRTWVVCTGAKEGFVGLQEIVHEAILKREKRLVNSGGNGALWEETKRVVRREATTLKLLTRKIHSRCGCV